MSLAFYRRGWEEVEVGCGGVGGCLQRLFSGCLKRLSRREPAIFCLSFVSLWFSLHRINLLHP